MADIWDKVKVELDKAEKAAREVLDEGKLRVRQFKVKQDANRAAEDLGYLVYRARKDGREPEQGAYSKLVAQLTENDAELERIAAALKKIDEDGKQGGEPSSPSPEEPAA